AQTSGWHILQAGFNGAFLTDRLNDINGFLLLVSSVFFLTTYKVEEASTVSAPVIFIILFNVLLFQFINAPSPDLPLILLSQLLFFMFINAPAENGRLMMVLL